LETINSYLLALLCYSSHSLTNDQEMQSRPIFPILGFWD